MTNLIYLSMHHMKILQIYYDEASLESENEIRSKIMDFYIAVAKEHEYKHLSYARNAIEISTKKTCIYQIVKTKISNAE